MPIATNDKGDVVYLGEDGQWQPAQIAENPETKERMAFDGQSWVPVGAQPSVAADVAKSFGIGIPKGLIALAGLPGDLPELGARGINAAVQGIGSLFPSLDVGPSRAPQEPSIGSAAIRRGVEGVTGPLYEPKTTAGEYAQTVGEFLPAAATGPGGIARRFLLGSVAPGIASEAAGQATQGTALEPFARAGAALAAPSAARRLITPLPTSPGRAAMAETLREEGVTPTAGQVTGSKSLQYGESTLGDFPFAGNKATAASERNQTAFTRAAFRRIGMDAEPTPANVNQSVQNIQNEFERLSSGNTLRYDQQFAQDVGRTLNRYGRKLPSQQREVIDNYVNDFTQFPGTMPGDVYQTARSDLSRQAHSMRNLDPTFSDALRGLRDALDNAMRRSISPADRQAWDTARRQWGNWRTLERAAKETDAAGNVKVTPAALKQAASTRNPGAFARGEGDFNELARAGSEILRPLPQSGTGPRVTIGALAGVAGGVGAGTGFLPALGALAVPPIAGRALMSPPIQAYLRNQAVLPPAGLPPSAALLPLIAAQHGPLRLTVRPSDASR